MCRPFNLAVIGVFAVCFGMMTWPATAQVTMQFPVERENSILGWDNHDGFGDPAVFDKTLLDAAAPPDGPGLGTEEFSNHGFKARIRGRKSTQHAAIMDWDTAAINDWVTAQTNPGDTLSWTLNVYPADAPLEDIQVLSLESENDWIEGDGAKEGNSFENFNWTEGTGAVTTNFAQTFYTIDGDGDKILDEARSLPWIDNETGTGGIDDNQYSILGRADNFSAGLPIPDFQNSVDLTATDLDDAAFDFTFASVPLDDDLINAVLNDPVNRGIILGPLQGAPNLNWQIWTREASGIDDEIAAAFPGPMAAFLEVTVIAGEGPPLQAGDADIDLDVDQFDLIQVQQRAKYLTGDPATWGDGDWDGAPGGSPNNPPAGNGLFDQLDIVATLAAGKYLTGPYAAIANGGARDDGQTSIVYDANTGELGVDAPAGTQLTSINIDSAAGVFTGEAAQNLGGSFDNDADNNIFKATFGSSFGSLSFGNVAQAGLSEQFVLGDLTVVGSLAGGGDLGAVDLIYVPEPVSALLLAIGLVVGLIHVRRSHR